MADDNNWHYEVDGAEYGPVPSVVLKRLATLGKLSPDDRVRRPGDSRWAFARNVKGLFETNETQLNLPLQRDAGPTTTSIVQEPAISDWGLASLMIGCTMLMIQNSVGLRFIFMDSRKSVTTIFLLTVFELMLLAGVAFGMWAGICACSAARNSKGGRGLPIAGVVMSSLSLLGWLIGLISIIRALDGDRW